MDTHLSSSGPAVPSGRLRPLQSRPDTQLCHFRAIERVINAMRGRLDDILSLEDMADLAIMSPFHFNRTFRQLTGIPPCQFYAALRLEAARRLLVTTKLSVTEICFEVGYNSLGTFTRRFNELLGLSPRQVRTLARSPLRLSSLFDKVSPPAPDAGPEPRSHSQAGLEGCIGAPEGFAGLIFVGMFPGSVPQGRPRVCTVLKQTGAFRIPWLADGEYTLMAAGLPAADKPEDLFLYESALRTSGKLAVRGGRQIGGPVRLSLRPPALTDPPILLTFPAVVQSGQKGPEPRPGFVEA